MWPAPILDGGRPSSCVRDRVDPSMSSLTMSHTVMVLRCLTSLVPQPRHRTVNGCHFPWSERFEHIFRNEEVTGSNPVTSTESPGQGRATLLHGVSHALAGDPPAPQRFHSPAGDSNHEHLSKRGAPRVDPHVLAKSEVGPVS